MGSCSLPLFPLPSLVCLQYLVAIGTGGIKPCVSTFGADQFDEDDPAELAMIPRFYNWFYAFINIGAFLACTLIVWVQTDVRWAAPGAVLLGEGGSCSAPIDSPEQSAWCPSHASPAHTQAHRPRAPSARASPQSSP